MKNISNKLNAEVISFDNFFKYRNVWMFFAIIWVVLFHLPIELPSFLSGIKTFGYGGVDIFLFASGIGCYFSLSKNSNIKQYLSRRIAKIMPMQILFLIIYFSAKSISITEIIGNISGMGFFAGLKNQFNWYIGAMWACYLLAPIFKNIVSRAKTISIISVFLILILVSIVYFNQFQLIFWARLPIFWMGFVVAEISKRKSSVTLLDIIISSFCFFIGLILLFLSFYKFENFLWAYGFWWYPFILITPGLTLLISIIFNWISGKGCGFIVKHLDKFGQHTFPLYLSHIFIFDIASNLRNKFNFINDFLYVVLEIVSAILFAVLLHYITVFIKYIFYKVFPIKKSA